MPTRKLYYETCAGGGRFDSGRVVSRRSGNEMAIGGGSRSTATPNIDTCSSRIEGGDVVERMFRGRVVETAPDALASKNGFTSFAPVALMLHMHAHDVIVVYVDAEVAGATKRDPTVCSGIICKDRSVAALMKPFADLDSLSGRLKLQLDRHQKDGRDNSDLVFEHFVPSAIDSSS